ncbi:exodeoxyribonuclease VII large subunit [uncultured Actinomyces sp.]|uniref:exodeoxyribonuclease VII large subunit n=1 Tax=uncultured Actinomyces sp. TaxID=249061 RepID=UPI0028D491F7|nr:exodeoxyribonuclease VII large subunit [uncultured Actinomyces sp.]
MPPAAKAADTTRDNPWPLSRLTQNIKIYVDRMSPLWVEGQVVQYNPRPGSRMAFFTLRDTESDTSMTVTAFPNVITAIGAGFEEGVKVVARVKPVFWERSGSLNLQAAEVHLQGLGDLLAQIERLRQRLAAEGLFETDRKKPLPFLPRVIGLVCGRNAKAKDDVIVNASARWPGAHFEVREVAVQGQYAVREVTQAIAELDSLPQVDVIVVARGGGSVEDLLPFSDEALVRAAAQTSTPLVSAIGHEGDAPLLDYVADYRASTPTDAARRIVPDLAQELDGLARAREGMRSAIQRRLAQERYNLDLLVSRPIFLAPAATLEPHRTFIDSALTSLRTQVERRLSSERQSILQASATLQALSPQATLERGYSMLRLPSGELVRDASQVPKGTLVEGILAQGRLVAQVVGSTPATRAPESPQ